MSANKPERFFKAYKLEQRGIGTFENFKGMFKGSDDITIAAITKMYKYGGCEVKEVTEKEYSELVFNLEWKEID